MMLTSLTVIIATSVPLNKLSYKRAIATPCNVDFSLFSSCNVIKMVSNLVGLRSCILLQHTVEFGT